LLSVSRSGGIGSTGGGPVDSGDCRPVPLANLSLGFQSAEILHGPERVVF